MGLTFVLMNHVNSSLCHLTIGFTRHFWLQKRELSLSPEKNNLASTGTPRFRRKIQRVTGSNPIDVEVIIEKSHLLIIQQFLELDW